MALVQSIEHPPLLGSPISFTFPRRSDSFASSGRGGSGNIRRSSVGRDARPSVDVGTSPREKDPSPSTSKFVSVGRGGSGNLQPPSPDLADHPMTAAIVTQHRQTESRYEEQVRKCYAESKVVSSSGRGGLGNINNNRRSKSRPPTSGRQASNSTEHTIIDTLHLIRPKALASLKIGSSSSRARADSTQETPCSSTAPHNAPKKPKRRRTFLKAWNKSPMPPPPLPSHPALIEVTEDSGQMPTLDVSSDNSDHLQVNGKRISRGGISVTSTCSSASGNTFLSQMSTQSLPVLPEDREQESWDILEEICSRYSQIPMSDDY